MRLASLTSGGKDSILAVCRALDAGHEVVAMISVLPDNPESYMFHSANLDAVPVMAERAGMQYAGIRTAGKKEEELTDLEHGIETLRKNCRFDGLVTGAIASTYQKSRLETVCRNLGLELYAPLWHADYDALIDEVISRLDAMIVVTAADGLDAGVLGRRFDPSLKTILKDVERKRRINIAGEGGEYESLVLNAPFFSKPVSAIGMKKEFSGMVGHVSFDRFE